MDLYHKTQADDWVIINYQPGDTIELSSIGLSFAIEHVYRGLTLTPDCQRTI
jgi:Uma2 family endonuclease